MDATLAAPAEEISGRSPRPWNAYALRALIWVLIAAVFWIAFVEGLHLRWWVFQIADPIRFVGDMNRGVYWGLVASGPEGYLNQYDKMDPQVPEWQDSRWVPWLDYGPLRLLVMREWGAWLRTHHPPDPDTSLEDQWRRPYWFSAPVLHFNEVLEVFSAMCAFFLTRLWVVRGTAGEKHGHFNGVWQGAAAALLIWFSADIIISAHGWPQWDSWPVPWYLCGCLLASLDWWFAAGVSVAIGVAFKGQMLSISPIFIIWPLVMGRPGAALRWICGAVFATAIIAAGWLITYLPPDALAAAREMQESLSVDQYPPDLFAIPRIFDLPAFVWLVEMLLVVATVPWLVRTLTPGEPPPGVSPLKKFLYSRWAWIAGAVIFIFAAVYWPWLLPQNRAAWYYGLLAAAAVAAAAMLLRPRKQPYVLAAIVGGGLLACIGLFHGSTDWWDCAIHYGSIHWPYLVTGPASNIPAYFQLRFGWDRQVDQIAFTLPAIHGHWPSFITSQSLWPAFDFDVTAKILFDTIYGIMLLISGIAIGIQARRNDRRMLVALVTPWLMFFLIPVQIQERYLLYASGAAACCIGNSVGTALLGLLITLLSANMHLIRMLDWDTADLDRLGQNLSQAFPHLFSPQSGQTMLQYCQAMHPDMAWAVLVIGLVFLYLSLTPSPRRLIAASMPGAEDVDCDRG
ncbi:MAG TPA: hypothetical protein VHX86_04220 [Tepidisphaeraceae bacterium]|jgi:hypothetical protein|nr:hypothetical protein [Tepidisphaeraceae bacterium]